MVGFLKAILGNRADATKQNPALTYEQIEGMSFNELVALITPLAAKTSSFASSQAILRRLHQIALFDNHVPDEQRAASAKLAEVLAADMENSISNNPEGLAALKAAISQTHKLARQGGYGSLVWRLNEYPMSGAETIPYIMRPAHRNLVPDFLGIVGPEYVATVRRHMVRELILQASYNSRNSVLILHGLATKGDKAAAALFTADEYRALLNVPGNYGAGRAVLVGLGILPAIDDLEPFKPVSAIKGVLTSSLQDFLREITGLAEADARISGLPDEKRHAILLTLTFLRFELARALLCQIYGAETAYDVITIFSDPATIEQLNRFTKAAQVSTTMVPGTPVDFALLDAVMNSGEIAAQSEEEFNSDREFLEMAVEWLNNDRVETLDSLRFKLRVITGSSSRSKLIANAQEDSIELDR